MKKFYLPLLTLFFYADNAHAQNVGIGTPSPLARLHVVDSSVVFSALGDVPANPGLPPISGSGRRMIWYADKAAFRAGFSTTTFWNYDNIGFYSTAFGNGTKAKGSASFATGYSTEANGNFSTSMGLGGTADGIYATALGNYTAATGYASLSLGVFNDPIVGAQGSFDLNPTTPLFIIGNGDDFGARKNALVVRKDGRMGMGTNFPAARLHVADSSVVFSAEGATPANPGEPPISGIGRRMMWYADKAAFRAGYVASSNWNKDSVGMFSAAFGAGTKAKGNFSFATGSSSFAIGNYSVAMGQGRANAPFSVAIGSSSEANGDLSTAIGTSCEANGVNSSVFGLSSIGNGYSSFVIGLNNDPVISTAQTSFTSNTPLFIIGNGNSFSERSNAMVVRKDGRVGIGTNVPLSNLHIKQTGTLAGLTLENDNDGNRWRIYSASGDNDLTFYNNANVEVADIDDVTGTYEVVSDMRLKRNIENLREVLPRLLKLEPKSYHFNWQQTIDQKEIGMLAQHTYQYFPELVSYDKENDIYKMNYAGFSTVAIKAIQEQQEQIKQLEEALKTQQAKFKLLEEEIQEVKKLIQSK